MLHLSYSNAAGLPQAWAKAHRQAGIDAWHLAEIENDFGFPSDEVYRWSNGSSKRQIDQKLDHWIRHATHIVAHDSLDYARVARASGKPWMYRAFGTHTFRQLGWVRRITKGVPRVTDFVEFVHHGFGLDPMPIWAEDYELGIPTTEFSVAHAPSNRSLKGTEAIIRVCARAGIPLDLIEGEKHVDCLRRKSHCHAFVDMIRDEHHPHPERLIAYAVNGLEAMAMGIPVLGEASPQVLPAMEEFGKTAYVQVTEATLEDELIRLRDNIEHYAERVAMGFNYLSTHHNPQLCAERDLALLGL